MTTIRKHIEACIRQNSERNRRLKVLLGVVPNLDKEIDPAKLANEAHMSAMEMGLDRFLHEEMDMNSMALRRILNA